MRRLWFLATGFFLLQCGKAPPVSEGRYAVYDAEYSDQGYGLEREFKPGGTFFEQHALHRCVQLELEGSWKQERAALRLRYARSRSRRNCSDSLGVWKSDSADVEIPIRNVEPKAYESFLSPAPEKPGRWLKWIRTEA